MAGPALRTYQIARPLWEAGHRVMIITLRTAGVYQDGTENLEIFNNDNMHFLPFGPGDGIIKGAEPLARISWGDPNRRLAGDDGLLVTPGLMLYFGPRVRIGAGLDIWEPRSGKGACSFKAQAYLRF